MRPLHYCHQGPRHQQGVALFVAMIVLVAMSIAGVALVRSVDTGSMIARNVTFQQSATLSGDKGIEEARTWLMSNASNLLTDRSGDGYYATSQNMLDLTGNATPGNTVDDVNWEGKGGISAPHCLAADNTGNTACYVIHRLCDAPGPLEANTCSTQETVRDDNSIGSGRVMGTYLPNNFGNQAVLMGTYRVTIRVRGPRNNSSFLQAFILL